MSTSYNYYCIMHELALNLSWLASVILRRNNLFIFSLFQARLELDIPISLLLEINSLIFLQSFS